MSAKKKSAKREHLEKVRNGHRRYTEKALGNATEILNESEAGKEDKLEQIQFTLKDRQGTLKSLDEQILNLLDDEEEIFEEIESSGIFLEKIHEILVKISKVMMNEAGTAPVNNHTSAEQKTKTVSQQHVKLPKLSLKRFSGEASEWQTFWDCFKSAVHENTSISSIDKFNYLKGLLESSAALTVSGLPLTESNYESAIELLKQRFGNKQVIISSHMDKLLQIQPLNSSADVRKLRQLYDKIESHVRGLQALDVSTEHYGSLLVPVLMSKLPEEIRLLLGRSMKEEEWNLDLLLTSLRQEVENRERCNGIQVLNTQKNSDKVKYSTAKEMPTTASALFQSSNERKSVTNCTFCKQQHNTVNCHVVTDIGARKQIVREQGRCFICLRRNHLAKKCISKGKCFKCEGRHHVSLCRDDKKEDGAQISQKSTQVQSTSNNYAGAQSAVLLQTAQAYLGTNDSRSEVRIRLIFDSGSQRTYISKKVSDQLQLCPVSKESLLIKTFGKNKTEPKTVDVVAPLLRDIHRNTSTQIQAVVVETICLPLENQCIDKAKTYFSHFQDIEFADSNDGDTADIDLLIGADYLWSFFTGKVIRGETICGIVASETILGWVLSGSIPSAKKQSLSSVNFVSTHVLKVAANENPRDPEDIVQRLWDFDSVGIREKETVHDSFLKNVSFHNDSYWVSIPVKEKHEILPDNYELSLARLDKQMKKLRNDPPVLKEYDRIIKEQLETGIIEKVEEQEDEINVGEIHYLPHQAVVRKDVLSTKVRVVYDASAKVKQSSPSLNDCVYSGPSLSQNILDILLRFRAHKVGLVADIEKAFLNINIIESQRDLVRFLWVDDISKEDPNVEVYRFCKVIFGMNCSPFLLNATLKYHISQYYSENGNLANKLSEGFYVDDWTSGGNDEDEAFQLYKEAKSCLSTGGFNLRKWASNSKELMERIISDRTGSDQAVNTNELSVYPDEDSFAKFSFGGLEEINITVGEHKVLGTNWDLNADNIVFKLEKISEFARSLEFTKRNVLRLCAKLYDPMGIISPILIPIKSLFQQLCKDKYDWDMPLAEEKLNIIKRWLSDIDKVKIFVISRCYVPPEVNDIINSISLHGFGDASMKAYCSVTYLCVETSSKIYTCLVASKARLAPLSKITIPRLELVAAVTTARLLTTVKEALASVMSLDKLYCWTDSKAVLYWIRAGKDYKQFVQNRVSEILTLTNRDIWFHCPGTQNPADIGSRGCLPTELANNLGWWEGPPWLRKGLDQYPTLDNICPQEEIAEEWLSEIRQKPKLRVTESTSVLVNLHGEEKTKLGLGEIINSENYSDFDRLIRVTAWVLRFINRVRRRKEEVENFLSGRELSDAKNMWLIEMQKDFLCQPHYKDLHEKLGLYEDDDGLLRCKGRLKNASLTVEAKYPVLLPRQHYITKLIVEKCHRDIHHGGAKETLSEIRSHYWIPRGRQLVRQVLFYCVLCKKLRGVSFKPPKHADLPEFRVTKTLAFTHVGVDYAGPMYVKPSDTGTQEMQKVYISLFTCASSRALHLELVPNMSAEAFMRCLRRFIGRRGIPSSITSDNAKTFKSVKSELGTLFKDQKVQGFVSKKGIKWNFILEKAPWWGGFYERLVQLVKRCLKKVLGNSRLTFEELSTVLTEVEGILNSRPLTYFDADLSEEPLTPSHLVLGRRLVTLPTPSEIAETFEDDQGAVRKRTVYLSKLLEHFWRRWTKEYLPSLREFHNCASKNGNQRKVGTDDVVLIQNDDLPRNKWKMGVVKRLLSSNDGETRGVVLRTLTKKGKPSVLQRPLQKIYPLEINGKESEQTQLEEPLQDQPQQIPDNHPKRAAAVRARNFINELVIDQAI